MTYAAAVGDVLITNCMEPASLERKLEIAINVILVHAI
jgi:hypothetical protein